MMPRPLMALVALAVLGGCSHEAAPPPPASTPIPVAAKPAEPIPQHRAVIAIFMGKADSSPHCSATNFQSDGLIFPTGQMSCGHPGKVSELRWTFLGRKGNEDIYVFTRKYPKDAPNSAMTSKQVGFTGEEIILFEDNDQTLLIRGPRS